VEAEKFEFWPALAQFFSLYTGAQSLVWLWEHPWLSRDDAEARRSWCDVVMIHLWGLPSPVRNWLQSPSCCTVQQW